MADPSQLETTQLLRAWAGGDERALTELVPRVHKELCRLAGHFLQNERPGVSLQAADLVQEVYLRLVDINQLDWQHRAHFFAVSATMMRRILLDRARRRSAAKRGRMPEAARSKNQPTYATENRSLTFAAPIRERAG
jgi:RNA polymerase sigma factor (TIGR02999 family)